MCDHISTRPPHHPALLAAGARQSLYGRQARATAAAAAAGTEAAAAAATVSPAPPPWSSSCWRGDSFCSLYYCPAGAMHLYIQTSHVTISDFFNIIINFYLYKLGLGSLQFSWPSQSQMVQITFLVIELALLLQPDAVTVSR